VTPKTTGCSNNLLTVLAKRVTPKPVKPLASFCAEMVFGLKNSAMTATCLTLMAAHPNATRKISSIAPMSSSKGPSVSLSLKYPHQSSVSPANSALLISHSKSHSLLFIPLLWPTTGPKMLL
jgi:hypothetical protein